MPDPSSSVDTSRRSHPSSSLDNTKYSVGIFIDLKKASDTIDHDILATNYMSMVFVALHTNGYRAIWKIENNLYISIIITPKH